MLDVLWIDTTYSWCLACLDFVLGFINLSDRRKEGISGGIWRGCPCFRYQSIRRRLNKVLKYLAATDALSENSFLSSAFNRADEVAHFCFIRQNEAKASLTLPHRRRFSPVLATCSIHCCLSCLSDLLRGPTRRLYFSASPLRIACLH